MTTPRREAGGRTKGMPLASTAASPSAAFSAMLAAAADGAALLLLLPPPRTLCAPVRVHAAMAGREAVRLEEAGRKRRAARMRLLAERGERQRQAPRIFPSGHYSGRRTSL